MKRLMCRAYYFNRFCIQTKLILIIMQFFESKTFFVFQLQTFKVGFSVPKTFPGLSRNRPLILKLIPANGFRIHSLARFWISRAGFLIPMPNLRIPQESKALITAAVLNSLSVHVYRHLNTTCQDTREAAGSGPFAFKAFILCGLNQ